MIRKLNLHWIEWFVLIVLGIVIFFAVAGNSGLALWLKHGMALVGAGLQWVVGGIQQFSNGLGK